ncbi:hypothetical protein Tco_0817992 [Tanacetum coccineum]
MELLLIFYCCCGSVRIPFVGKKGVVGDDLNVWCGSAIYRVKTPLVPKFSWGLSVISCSMSTLPTKGMRSIISTVSISLEGFLPSILLLVVTVVIVAVILVFVVVAIVGVAIVVTIIRVVTIIGVVVVVSGVSSIIKLLFVIIGFLHRITLYYLLHQPLSYANGFLLSLRF